MVKNVGRVCVGCGLPVDGDSLPMDGNLFHPSCALDEPASQEESEERKYRAFLKRTAHWGNSVGWGQGS